MFRPAAILAAAKSSSVIRRPIIMTIQNMQTRQAHAISNPTLVDIEKRWEKLPPQEQAELWMSLRDRMKVDWSEMTFQEKKAAYYLAFGPHGPRAEAPPGEGRKVAGYATLCVGISFVLFCIIRSFARPPPSTMTKEWQEATNEYLKANNNEPLTGISSQGYEGPGYVQSDSEKKK